MRDDGTNGWCEAPVIADELSQCGAMAANGVKWEMGTLLLGLMFRVDSFSKKLIFLSGCQS